MSVDLHQFFIFVSIKFLIPVFWIFHNKNCIFFSKIFFMDRLQILISTWDTGWIDQKPSDQRLITEIFLTVFHTGFYSRLRNIKFTFIFYNFRYPDGAGYVYTVLVLYLAFFTDQKSTLGLFLHFIAKLVQKCIHIIFYINFGAVTYISYLPYIFWKLFFHIFSPHIHIFSHHIIAETPNLSVYVRASQEKSDMQSKKTGRLVAFCTNLPVFFMNFVFPGHVLSTLRLSFVYGKSNLLKLLYIQYKYCGSTDLNCDRNVRVTNHGKIPLRVRSGYLHLFSLRTLFLKDLKDFLHLFVFHTNHQGRVSLPQKTSGTG